VLSRRFPDDEPEFAVMAASEEVASNNLEVEQPRTASLGYVSLATAAYTQPSAVYEVEEEEEEPDYPAEETDEEEVDEDIDEDTSKILSKLRDEPGADAEVLAAIPAVPSRLQQDTSPSCIPAGSRNMSRRQIEEEDESDDHGFEGNRRGLRRRIAGLPSAYSSLSADSGRRSAILLRPFLPGKMVPLKTVVVTFISSSIASVTYSCCPRECNSGSCLAGASDGTAGMAARTSASAPGSSSVSTISSTVSFVDILVDFFLVSLFCGVIRLLFFLLHFVHGGGLGVSSCRQRTYRGLRAWLLNFELFEATSSDAAHNRKLWLVVREPTRQHG